MDRFLKTIYSDYTHRERPNKQSMKNWRPKSKKSNVGYVFDNSRLQFVPITTTLRLGFLLRVHHYNKLDKN